jgi:hypothetical protein
MQHKEKYLTAQAKIVLGLLLVTPCAVIPSDITIGTQIDVQNCHGYVECETKQQQLIAKSAAEIIGSKGLEQAATELFKSAEEKLKGNKIPVGGGNITVGTQIAVKNCSSGSNTKAKAKCLSKQVQSLIQGAYKGVVNKNKIDKSTENETEEDVTEE